MFCTANFCHISKPIVFIKISLKFRHFSKKTHTKFSNAGGSSPRSPKHIPQQTSGYAPESNHVFALLISKPPKSYLMLRLKSSIFYQNKPKINSALQKKIFLVLGALPPDLQWPLAELPDPRTQPFSPLQISDYTPNTRRVLLILPSSRILQ